MGFYWFLSVLRSGDNFTFQVIISTVSLTVCIRCDHLLIGHHSCSGIVNLNVKKGRGRRGKEAQNVRENGEKLSRYHTHTHTYYISLSKKKKIKQLILHECNL